MRLKVVSVGGLDFFVVEVSKCVLLGSRGGFLLGWFLWGEVG